MGKVEVESVLIKEKNDKEIRELLDKNGISLTVEEARMIVEKLQRNPTLTELHVFNIEWSEHCSYKSSRELLKLLPTEGPTVMQGPAEDAGIINFIKHKGQMYGIVIGHESHNHPSQVVPYEGAATGIGGIVRDVLCMGAKVFATADPLRFGDPFGKNKNRTRYIANAVVDGIAGYGNPLGIPNMAGDVYFNESFDENCLVNVVCLGLIKKQDIIHSRAPKDSAGYDLILVGKATDNSGFGGASFASLNLEESEANKGAVQVPDPFLKNILLRASYKVFEEAKKKKITLGYKDLGAGGVMCASSELCANGSYGCKLDLDKVHVSMKDLPSYIIACAETQERLMWISPKKFTERILEIYNKEFELPNIAEGAQAKIVGEVTKDKDFIITHNGKIVCNAPIMEVTSGIRYKRQQKEIIKKYPEPELKEPDYKKTFLKILNHPNVASRKCIYERYDTNVMGNTVIGSGQADAGLMTPIEDCKAGVALSVDCNPIYTRIDPYMGSINAVAEAMRNVAAIGATPYGMTDCLNFGNPEIPEQFDIFVKSIHGIADAARNIYLKGTNKPVPYVSGNVSLYNQSDAGAVDPSPVIACLGVIEDYSKAITMKIKEKNSQLYLLGERKDELGGSVYYQLNNALGNKIPQINFEKERNNIYAVIDLIDERLLKSCHDISDGGFITTVAEMALGGDADGAIGVELSLRSGLRADKYLFSETSGFVFEISRFNLDKVKNICEKYNLKPVKIGETVDNKEFTVNYNDKKIIGLDINELKKAWTTGLKKAME